jgi:hypothetical protein
LIIRLGSPSTVDVTIAGLKGEQKMNTEDLYGSFSKEQIEEYRQEVREKWGEEALSQSEERIMAWTPEEFAWIEQESKEIITGIVDRINGEPDDEEVQELMQRYYDYINRFFDCSVEVFRELGRGYVEDDRFAAYFRQFHEDMPAFMRDAMAVFCAKCETER